MVGFLSRGRGTGLRDLCSVLSDKQSRPLGCDFLCRQKEPSLVPSLRVELDDLVDEVGQDGQLVRVGGQVIFSELNGVQEDGQCGERIVPPIHFLDARFHRHHCHLQVMH